MTDHVYTHELLREDEWTTDGRLLMTYSVNWWEQIPLLYHDPNIENDFGSIVGAIGNIRREGNKIYGDTDVEIPEDAVITATLDQVQTVLDDLGARKGQMRISSARLVGANVSEKGKYPWHDEEEEGGGANAR